MMDSLGENNQVLLNYHDFPNQARISLDLFRAYDTIKRIVFFFMWNFQMLDEVYHALEAVLHSRRFEKE